MPLVSNSRLPAVHRELQRLAISSSLAVVVIDVPTMPVPIEVERIQEFQQALHHWMGERSESGYYYFESVPMQRNGEYANKRRYTFYFTCVEIAEDLKNFCLEARLRYM